MRTLGIVVAIAAAAACGSRNFERHTPDEVRSAIKEAGVIGSSPDSALARLRRIRLTNGDSLEVGEYVDDADRRVIEVGVSDAKRTGRTVWSINAFVLFGASHKADSLDVHFSADN